MNKVDKLKQEAISLLKELIAIPSFSGKEDKAADKVNTFLQKAGIKTKRKMHNIWAENKNFQAGRPVLLLNSHLDTVRPNDSWQSDPFKPQIKDGKLFGLGSNDAGGSLVSLMAIFRYFYQRKDLHYNLIFAATAEEENSGLHGIESILPELKNIDFTVVGEPTGMKMAIAEKGLIVLDCTAPGKAGHAARNEGENAIINAMKDIEWFHSYQFPRESKLLGPIRMTVTAIQAGQQHNIIPDTCKFTVDIRTTDSYTHEEILEIIQSQVISKVEPRSTRLRPSKIELNHPIVQAAQELQIPLFGSPTTSDQAVIPFPSVKMGPGESERSHTADEFIYLTEIEEGIEGYINLFEKLNKILENQKILNHE
jgi:acetylornithine deacetylase